MSSWDPPEERETGSSHDPGVKEREVIEGRDFSEALYNFERSDFVLFGVVATIPAVFLTLILVWVFVPEFQATAGEFVRAVTDLLPLLGGPPP